YQITRLQNYKFRFYDFDSGQALRDSAARFAYGDSPPQRFYRDPGRSVYGVGGFLFSLARHWSWVSSRRRRVLSISAGGDGRLHFFCDERASLSERGAGSATDGNAGSAADDFDGSG